MKLLNAIITTLLVALTGADSNINALRGGQAVETAANEAETLHDRSLTSHKYYYYKGYHGQACRTSDGKKGEEGTDYELFTHQSFDWCMDYCSSYSDCKAFEWYKFQKRCEIWKKFDDYFEPKHGFFCFSKGY